MRAARALAWAALAVAPLALGGCAEGGLAGGLRAAGIRGTPDEFMVLPTRPLEMPENLSALPPPTPGAVNRVDYRPRQEAVAGLTGRPAVNTASGAALVAAAGPRDPAIRSELAAEDVEWRQTHHGLLLERVFSQRPRGARLPADGARRAGRVRPHARARRRGARRRRRPRSTSRRRRRR